MTESSMQATPQLVMDYQGDRKDWKKEWIIKIHSKAQNCKRKQFQFNEKKQTKKVKKNQILEENKKEN